MRALPSLYGLRATGAEPVTGHELGVENREFSGSRRRARTCSSAPRPAGQPARRNRRELVTTMTLEAAMAAPAIIGLSSPAAASGIAATL